MTGSEYHLIGGLTCRRDEKPFSFLHYLAVIACRLINRPKRMNFYYRYEPAGIWWERAKPLLVPIQVNPPSHIFGKSLRHPAHIADVLRLEILLNSGGVYLDTDILSVRPFGDLETFDAVLGEEFGVGLCNAVIMAKQDSRFLRRWLNEYKAFDDARWQHFSVIVPKRLAAQHPDEVHIVGHRKFFWPMYWRSHFLPFLLQPNSTFSAASYCVHMWQSCTWPLIAQLTPAHIIHIDSEFSRLTRPFIKSEWPESQPPWNAQTLRCWAQISTEDSKLPREARAAFLLRYMYSMDVLGVAFWLGCSEEQVLYNLANYQMLG